LSASDNELTFTSPFQRGIKYSQSLRVKRDPSPNSKADRSGWSFGDMAKALSSGVVQGTKAVGSGVVQGTMAVGTGVVQGTMAVGSGVVQGSIVVGSGVVQGSKAVGTGVVQGTKVVGTGVVQGTLAAGKLTKDVTIAVGKGVYHASEVVGNAAVTGVSAAGEATVSAGRVVTSASVNAVMDTTKWVKEQSESFGGDDHDMYTILPGDTLESISEAHEVSLYNIIRINQLQRRVLIPGKLIIIPNEDDLIKPHPDEILVTKAFIMSGNDKTDDTEAFVRFSTEKISVTSCGKCILDCHPNEVSKLQLDVCEPMDIVPDLLPANSLDECNTGFSTNQSQDEEEVQHEQQQQQHCHIVEVDIGSEESGGKRERRPTSDEINVTLKLTLLLNSPDDQHTTSELKLRFPQTELSSLSSYLELWLPENLQVSEAFQRHLSMESMNLVDCEDAGPHILDDSSILDDRSLREIYLSLPHKIQNQSWILGYSTRINGFSLQNLYRTLSGDNKDPCLLVIQDNFGFVFGAYLTCTPKMCETFIGTGKSWLFCFGKLQKNILEEDEEEDNTEAAEMIVVNGTSFNVSHWTGINEYFFRGTLDHMVVGAGDGKFGIFIDGDLHKGRIQECDTFERWPPQEHDFTIRCLECWKFA